jgi:hypothetical protein
MSLSDARKARDAAKLDKSEGRDPVQVRKLEKLQAARPDGDTFKAVALDWYGKQATLTSLTVELGGAEAELYRAKLLGPRVFCIDGRAR